MPLDKKLLLTLCERIEHLKSKDINEEDTRGILIDPLLQALDWDIFDVNEISRNSKTSSGGYVDYILKYNGKKIYLEAKPLSSKLTQKNQIQATGYAYEDNITFCVLTNGNRYQIFETFKKGTVTERLLIDISLDDGEMSLEKKIECLNFISKNKFINGDDEKIDETERNTNKSTGKLNEFQSLYLTIKKEILALGEDIQEVYFHQYNAVVFRRDTEFASMIIKPESKEIEFLLKFGEFEPNLEKIDALLVEVIPNAYRHGKTNFRATITKKEQIKEIINLVKQCYELQIKWRKN
ncbi:MAG: hypothetical protein ACFE9Z_08100 [Promethearchaeota archaeon]